MPNLASPEHGVEFDCRSAAKRCKPRSISAAGRGRQNRLNPLITNKSPAPRRRFSRTKTRFSAVDSGICGAPARPRPVARDPGNAQLQEEVDDARLEAHCFHPRPRRPPIGGRCPQRTPPPSRAIQETGRILFAAVEIIPLTTSTTRCCGGTGSTPG